MMSDEKLLTVPEAAARLNVAPWRVYELAAQGDLPAVRLGKRTLRFSPAQLAAFIENGGSSSQHRSE